MRSSVFSYPYERVFRKTQRTLSKHGMKIKAADALKGLIHAETPSSFLHPSLKVDFLIEEMENHDTKVTVREFIVKGGWLNRKVNLESDEIALLESLSTHI